MTSSKKVVMDKYEVTSRFFVGIIRVLSKHTSRDYSLVILSTLKNDLLRNFGFFKYITVKGKIIKIDSRINKVDEVMLGKMFMRIVDIIGPSLLRAMIQEELDTKTVECLENMGVIF